jgi:hypothetical protein
MVQVGCQYLKRERERETDLKIRIIETLGTSKGGADNKKITFEESVASRFSPSPSTLRQLFIHYFWKQ